MPQLSLLDFSWLQEGSPEASWEGFWSLLRPFLGHAWVIWRSLRVVLSHCRGTSSLIWGLLEPSLRHLRAYVGHSRCSLQALGQLEPFWDDLGLGWGGVGGVPKHHRPEEDLCSRSSYTRGD